MTELSPSLYVGNGVWRTNQESPIWKQKNCTEIENFYPCGKTASHTFSDGSREYVCPDHLEMIQAYCERIGVALTELPEYKELLAYNAQQTDPQQ